MQGARKSSYTFAPGGTQRLRDVINKNITERGHHAGAFAMPLKAAPAACCIL